MSRAEVPSYRFAEGELELEISAIRGCDDVIVEGPNVDARELGPSATLEIELELDVTAELLEKVLPPSQLENPPVKVLVAEESDRGRTRLIHEMQGKLPGELALAEPLRVTRSETFGEIRLTPLVVRSGLSAEAPYAGHDAALLADGEALVVSVDSKPPDAGEYLDTEYQPFSEGGKEGKLPQLKEYSHLMYFLDTTSSATGNDRAVLYLNSEIPMLQAVMGKPKRARGKDQRVKDATFATVTAQVWPQLYERACETVLLAIGDDGFEAGSGEAVAAAPEWARKAVEHIASSLYDSKKLADCVSEFESDLAKNREGQRKAVDKLIEEMVDPNGAFNGLVLLRDGRA